MARKRAIPLSVRREVALRYGCPPGGAIEVGCHYCGVPGRIRWSRLSNGSPSGWVTFPGLELDHVVAEALGGEATEENIVLACQRCNRSKGVRLWPANA